MRVHVESERREWERRKQKMEGGMYGREMKRKRHVMSGRDKTKIAKAKKSLSFAHKKKKTVGDVF